MPAIFRTPYIRTAIAAGYLESLQNQTLYCIIGRENDPKGVKTDGSIFVDGDGLWMDDTNPPDPTNSDVGDQDLWNLAIAGKQVDLRDKTLVLNRFFNTATTSFTRLWDDHIADNNNLYNPLSRIFVPFDLSINDGTFNEDNNTILVNQDREVFLCVDRAASGLFTATHSLPLDGTKTPSLTNHSNLLETDSVYFKDGLNSIIVIDMEAERINTSSPEGDNHYVWKYITTLDANSFANFISPQSNWIPINYANVLGPLTTNGAESQDSLGTSGNAPFILGLRHLMLRAFLDSSDTPGFGLPENINYREVFFVENPMDGDGVLATTNYAYMPNSVSDMSPPLDAAYNLPGHGVPGINTLTKYTGNILYTETRAPVFRQVGQTDEIFAILSY